MERLLPRTLSFGEGQAVGQWLYQYSKSHQGPGPTVFLPFSLRLNLLSHIMAGMATLLCDKGQKRIAA